MNINDMPNSLDILSFNNFAIFILLIFVYLIFNYYILLNNKKIKSTVRYILITSRTTFLLMLTLFLINPVLTFKKNIKNKIPLFIDNSMSMKYNFNLIDYDYNDIDFTLKKWSDNNNYILDYYLFGDEFVDILGTDEIDFTDKSTSINSLFENINSDIILITDGVINSGSIKIPTINNKINIIGIGNENNKYNDISIELINHEIFDDSLKIDFIINSNINEDLLNYNVYIENSKIGNKILIDTFDYYKNMGQISKSIRLSKEIISNNNFLYIDNYPGELNYNNNSVLFNVNDDKILAKKILFLTGAISSNTKYIKNNILTDVSNYEVDHYYRLKDNLWNINLKNINYSIYDIIVFDNFPSNNNDNKFVKKILNNEFDNILYFMGSSDMTYNNEILNRFDCSYVNISNKNPYDSQTISYNDKNFTIPLNLNNKPLQCDNSIINSSFGNSIIAENNKINLFLISDLQKLLYYNKYEEDNFNEFIKQYIDNTIYNNQYLNIYTNQNTFLSGDSIKIYFEINNTISAYNKYINILNEKKEILNQVFNNNNLDSNLFLFEFKINDTGKYYLQGNVDNINYTFNSDLVPIEIVENDLEISQIYLNANMLKLISRKSNGIYNKYDKLDVFLNNIKFNEETITKSNVKQMISYWYILIILIILLTVEWYYRNKYGLI